MAGGGGTACSCYFSFYIILNCTFKRKISFYSNIVIHLIILFCTIEFERTLDPARYLLLIALVLFLVPFFVQSFLTTVRKQKWEDNRVDNSKHQATLLLSNVKAYNKYINMKEKETKEKQSLHNI